MVLGAEFEPPRPGRYRHNCMFLFANYPFFFDLLLFRMAQCGRNMEYLFMSFLSSYFLLV